MPRARPPENTRGHIVHRDVAPFFSDVPGLLPRYTADPLMKRSYQSESTSSVQISRS